MVGGKNIHSGLSIISESTNSSSYDFHPIFNPKSFELTILMSGYVIDTGFLKADTSVAISITQSIYITKLAVPGGSYFSQKHLL